MIDILFYTILTILILFLLGFGVTMLAVPDRLKKYALWLTPWFTTLFLVFFLTLFSLAGVSTRQISPYIILTLILLSAYTLFIKKSKYTLNWNQDLLIGLFIGVSIVLNLSPLIRHEKILTTISMGNNDVIVYAQTPDYLANHSIFEYFQTKVNKLKPADEGTGNLIYSGYRWGTPLLSSFFLNLYQIKGYQFAYLFQVILFALAIPLVYLLVRLLYKPSFMALFTSIFLFAFNSNLLYMLYHNFFGQVFFWGTELFLLIFIFIYFSARPVKQGFTKFDYIIGISIASLYFAYHESVVFILIPLVIFFLLYSILYRTIALFFPLVRICLIVVLSASISIVNSVIIGFLQASGFDAPIGWALFRSKIPFANPFEAMGFYSIHAAEPMPLTIAIILSLLTFFVILKGFLRIKQKLLAFSFIIVYCLFFLWTSVLHHNFFVYNRALTYTLPFFIVLFSIGIVEIFKRKRKVLIAIIFVLLSLEFFYAIKLNKRFLLEHITVDKSLISLQEIHTANLNNEAIYTEQTLTGLTNYWQQIWTDYFLYPSEIYTPLNFDISKKEISDNSLFLVSKNSIYRKPVGVLLKNTVWENEYWKLGGICYSDSCLLKSSEDLSKITFGKSQFDDILLKSGWSIKEGNFHWSNSLESTVRLVTRENKNLTKLVIEVASLSEPQKISVYINDNFIGEKNISKEWKAYIFDLPNYLTPGVQKILFKFSNIYKPVDLGLSLDNRDLSVNFRRISLE